MFAPTSSALLQQGILKAISANQIVLPAMTRPVLFEGIETSSGVSQSQIIQTAVHMLRRCGMAPLQQQSLAPAQPLLVPSLPFLVPALLSQQTQNFALGFHLSPID